jgi:hypothetical protein
VALREDTELDEAEMTEVRQSLARMDRGGDSPWTWQTLRLIGANAGVVSTGLAAIIGLERQCFRRHARRLKEMGLTESPDVGYRISPHGQALLNAGKDHAEGP